jgi:hypothetical protein
VVSGSWLLDLKWAPAIKKNVQSILSAARNNWYRANGHKVSVGNLGWFSETRSSACPPYMIIGSKKLLLVSRTTLQDCHCDQPSSNWYFCALESDFTFLRPYCYCFFLLCFLDMVLNPKSPWDPTLYAPRKKKLAKSWPHPLHQCHLFLTWSEPLR